MEKKSFQNHRGDLMDPYNNNVYYRGVLETCTVIDQILAMYVRGVYFVICIIL